jgi:hypothetical protein
VTANAFRNLALSLPGVVEGSHMGHADFRVGGKIFASLGPEKGRAMVKLTPDTQSDLVGEETGPFRPAGGAWGLRGCTLVDLSEVDGRTVRAAILDAWRNTAPKRLLAEHEGQ